MRINFGKLILAPAVLAAAVLATTSANAETTVKVPFSFSAAGKIWPAGTYTIQKEDFGNIVTITSRESSQSTSWLVGPGEADPDATAVMLKFDTAGNYYALRSIQYGAEVTGQLDRSEKHAEHLVSIGR